MQKSWFCWYYDSINLLFFKGYAKKRDALLGCPVFGAADRNRTGTDFTPRDFKSLVSTYSTTAAYYLIMMSLRLMVPLSCCGTRQLRRRQRGFLICRPLPLAPLAPPATGGARVAPRNRTGTDFTPRDFKSLVSTDFTIPAEQVLWYHISVNPSSLTTGRDSTKMRVNTRQ